MIGEPQGNRTKPSNRLTHGLTSRARAEDMYDDARKMADELVGEGPRTPEILEAAIALARQIMLLQAIRSERKRLLTTPPPPRNYKKFHDDPDFEDLKSDILNGGSLQEMPKTHWARWLIACAQYEDVVSAYVPSAEGAARLIAQRRLEFRRLDEYERKAMSRRRKLLRKMDHLTVDTLRGKVETSR